MLSTYRSLAALPLVPRNSIRTLNVNQPLPQVIVYPICGTKTLTTTQFTRQKSYCAGLARINSHVFSSLALTRRGLSLPTRLFRSCSTRQRSELLQKAAFKFQASRALNTQASSERRKPWNREELHVPIGGSGTVMVDVFSSPHSADASETGDGRPSDHSNTEPDLRSQARPSKSPPSLSKQRNVLLIYLPPGSVPCGVTSRVESEFEEMMSNLAQVMSTDFSPELELNIARINYRLERGPKQDDEEQDFRFPIPVHDVTTCFEAIVRRRSFSILANKTFCTADATKIESKPVIYLVGSHIGGSLALTLALTNHEDIDAVAAIDPVVDWVGLDEIATTVASELGMRSSDTRDDSDIKPREQVSPSRRKRSPKNPVKPESLHMQCRAAQAMIDLRTSLFRTPSGYFDQFASPILFLRAPGKDTPLWRSARPVLEEASNTNTAETFGPYDDDWHAVHQNHIDGESYKPQEEFTQSRVETEANMDMTNLSAVYDDSVMSKDSSSLEDVYHSQSSFIVSDAVSEADMLKSVKRRKSLRRWPSVRPSEEALLPHVRIFSTAPASTTANEIHADNLDLACVLHPQAKEMVDVMRRACFWGREKSLAEERVTIELLEPEKQLNEEIQEQKDGDVSANGRTSRLCEWLIQTVNGN